MSVISFQDIILTLTNYWHKYGCVILQPHDLEMGAGTFHPATVLKSFSMENWNVAYVQPSRRPTDSRYGKHPNRLQHYYQFQVILKPSPDNVQDLYLDSLAALGIDFKKHDIRFIEDDWESPTLGAWGLGWEVWCNGMEISQFTYVQQIGSIECDTTPVELTYGLERIALYLQDVSSIRDIIWNNQKSPHNLTYGDVEYDSEEQFSHFNLKFADPEILKSQFNDAQVQCANLIENNLPIVAYDQCIKASHLFNVLDARGLISVTERASYITKVRDLARQCCKNWCDLAKSKNNRNKK